MTKRSKYAPIPAEEVIDPKSWHLPYWVEPPHLVQQEEEEVLVEEEEIEIEPLTAEQLEQIRQEAYNEGLEQGLVEGRQKGEKAGFDQGHKEGFAEGKKEGLAQGQIEGKAQGDKRAEQEGRAKTDKKIGELQAVMQALIEPIDGQLDEIERVLPELVLQLSKTIVASELSQGSEHIETLCQKALGALPIGAKNIRVFVSESDLPYLEQAIKQQSLSYKVQLDKSLLPGGCRVESEESIVDFTLTSRWQALEEQYKHQFKLADLKTTLDPELGTNDQQPRSHVEEERSTQPSANMSDDDVHSSNSEQTAPVEESLGANDTGLEQEKPSSLTEDESLTKPLQHEESVPSQLAKEPESEKAPPISDNDHENSENS